MVVKYCKNCVGKPYTSDLQLEKCPRCGRTLCIESIDDIDLEDRQQIVIPNRSTDLDEIKDTSSANEIFDDSDLDSASPKIPIKKQRIPQVSVYQPYAEKHEYLPEEVIHGRVAQYSSTGKEDGNYRRLLITKIIDAVAYHQRIEDVLHRFNVRVENGKDAMGYSQYADIPVNVHGTIASGSQISDNAEVEVEGKYRNGVLMASKVSVVNNGYHSQIKFQRSISAIVYGVLVAVAAIALVVFVANTDGSFFDNLKSFLLTWLVVSIVTAVLYLILIFSKIGFLTRMATGKPKKFPIMGILLFSLIVTMIFMNSSGIGTSLSGLFSNLLVSIIPVTIVIIVIILLIKLIFK